MRCFTRGLGPAIVLLLIVSPEVVSSRSRRSEERVHHESKSGTEVHPIAYFVAGTVSVAGSLFSIHKHRRHMAMDKKQKAAAEEVIRAYRSQQDMGCRVLDQTAVLMHSKRQGLQMLADDNRNGTHALSSSCVNGAQDGRMKHFEETLRVNLRAACQLLEVDRSSQGTPLSQFSASCMKGAKLESLTERICEENGDGLARAMQRSDLDMARLDGVMTGLCDGLPEFQRTVIKHDVPYGSSLIAREVSRIPPGYANLYLAELRILDMIALSYSVLGSLDFGLDLYHTAVSKNDGYAILLDVVKQDAHKQHDLLWSSFQVYWLDVAWMRSVQLATLAERYQAASLSVPEHFWVMNRAESPLLWHRNPNLDAAIDGSYWVCSQKMKCLVPIWDASASDAACDLQDRSKLSSCETTFGDMKMCSTASNTAAVMDEPLQVFGLSPRQCFELGFGGDGVGFLSCDAWVFRFGGNAEIDAPLFMKTSREDEYSEAECLGSLRSLAQSTTAESSLRSNLISLSNEVPK